MKVVQRMDRQALAHEMNPRPPQPLPQEPQPSWAVLSAARQQPQEDQYEYDDFDQGHFQQDFDAAGPSNYSLPGVARGQAKPPVGEREGRGLHAELN